MLAILFLLPKIKLCSYRISIKFLLPLNPKKSTVKEPNRFIFENHFRQKQPFSIPQKTTLKKCDFKKVDMQLVHLLHIFKTPFPKTTSGGLLLYRRIEFIEKVVIIQKNIKRENICHCL